MKITAVTIKDFKRIKEVSITPGADRALILIGGKNAQGKSSLLDGLTVALGGKRAQPSDPVRHGADEAEITVELDGGDLTINRVIQPGGESVLEVRDRLGAIKSPQALLDKMLGARSLDPIQFLSLTAKDQRTQLMRLIEGADRITELNGKRERVFTKRTEIGRDLKSAAGELERLKPVEVGTLLDVAEMTAESKKLAELQRGGDGLGSTYEQCKRETVGATARLKATTEAIVRLRTDLAKLEAEESAWTEDVARCKAVEAETKAKLDAAGAEWAKLAPRRDELDKDLGRAGEHNRAVITAEAHMKRRAEAEETVAKLTAEDADLTKVIATIDDRKASILAAAKLPVEGLGVTDDGIELAGVPFAQASAAERVRVAIGLAIHAAAGLDDVFLRDGALLDDDFLAMVAAQAAAAGKQLWVERVGTKDPGVIVISDGKVVAS